MPGPRLARNLPTGVSSPSAASSSTRPSPIRSDAASHALLVDRRLMLDLGAEEPLVGLERLIEILDGDAEMMNAARLHAGDATQSRRLGAV